MLERCATARESVDLIGQLLVSHGQGGPCSEESKDWAYHNSFLVVDCKEAWVVETAGKLWVAKVVKGKSNKNKKQHLICISECLITWIITLFGGINRGIIGCLYLYISVERRYVGLAL